MTPKEFACACYHVLTREDPHPFYLAEKTWMLNAGFEAWGALDENKKKELIIYLDTWGFELPKQVIEYEESVHKLQENK